MMVMVVLPRTVRVTVGMVMVVMVAVARKQFMEIEIAIGRRGLAGKRRGCGGLSSPFHSQ